MKLALAFAFLAACGGGSKPTTTTVSQPAKTEGEHHEMSPALTKFHDVLSPRWHAAQGAQRMTDTCGAIADFQTTAAEVANKELSDAVAALEATCKANDATAFEPAFEKVHTTFHGLMEASGGGHEEHGGHDHGEHKHGG